MGWCVEEGKCRVFAEQPWHNYWLHQVLCESPGEAVGQDLWPLGPAKTYTLPSLTLSGLESMGRRFGVSYHNYRPLLHLIVGMTCQDALPPVTSFAGRSGCPWTGSEECRAVCLHLCVCVAGGRASGLKKRWMERRWSGQIRGWGPWRGLDDDGLLFLEHLLRVVTVPRGKHLYFSRGN